MASGVEAAAVLRAVSPAIRVDVRLEAAEQHQPGARHPAGGAAVPWAQRRRPLENFSHVSHRASYRRGGAVAPAHGDVEADLLPALDRQAGGELVAAGL